MCSSVRLAREHSGIEQSASLHAATWAATFSGGGDEEAAASFSDAAAARGHHLRRSAEECRTRAWTWRRAVILRQATHCESSTSSCAATCLKHCFMLEHLGTRQWSSRHCEACSRRPSLEASAALRSVRAVALLGAGPEASRRGGVRASLCPAGWGECGAAAARERFGRGPRSSKTQGSVAGTGGVCEEEAVEMRAPWAKM
mmetsp:Transcript_8824/g.27963  ORF Transcript_8824/g.27963 Transcript_8824/m.27963 type:complete len:201 (-) Transcript_8824:1781-2383(-)